MLVQTRCQLKEQLASKATELDDAAAATVALERRLAEEEEDRRNAHTSVMRLEAQVMNRLANFMPLSDYCPNEGTCSVFYFVFYALAARMCLLLVYAHVNGVL